MVEIKVPDIGDFKSVDVIEILVKPGDTVAPEQSLVTLESDKATMEIPSPSAGTVKSLIVKIGDKVSEGSLLLMLDAAEAKAPAAPAAKAPAAPRGQGAGIARGAGSSQHLPASAEPRRPAAPTFTARSWCSVPGPAATPPRSARPISARTRCSSSATRRSAASA